MRVAVPRNLAGGSLLQAHNWVKSSIARANPSNSTDNYSIQTTDGTPITLSDLTTKPFDEVILVSGARSNPSYPVADMDILGRDKLSYPSYPHHQRIGNNLSTLLSKDIDSSLLERLIAQSGTFSALNTITKLMYSSENDMSASDPELAKLLQQYSNAQKKGQYAMTNPGRAFFARDINDEYRGVLSPEEAVRKFAEQQFNTTLPRDSPLTHNLVDRARIVRMYDLNNQENVQDFVDDVLTPYLVISMANANLIKAMREHHRNIMVTEMGRFTQKSPYDSQVWKKLINMMPIKANDFYEGKDYALVANPIFLRESLAIGALNKKLIKRIFNLVKKFPGNAKEANQRRLSVRGRITNVIRGLWQPADSILFEALLRTQQNIINDTDPEKNIGLLRKIFFEDLDVRDINSYLNIPAGDLVSFQKDVAGFRPTPPPYWPKPVVLAMMDVIRDNIHEIIREGNEEILSAAFLRLQGTPYDPTAVVTLEYTNSEDKKAKKLVTVKYLSVIIRWLREKKTSVVLLKDAAISTPGENELVGPPEKLTGKTSKKYLEEIKWIITTALYQPKYFDGDPKIEEIIATLTNRIQSATIEQNEIVSTSKHVVGVLNLFMEIEEISRHKYNYTMSENDRAFVLFLLEATFNELHRRTPGDFGRMGPRGDGGEPLTDQQLVRIAQGIGDSVTSRSLTEEEANHHIRFNAEIDGIIAAIQHDIQMGERSKIPITPQEITDVFEGLRRERDPGQTPEWVLRRFNEAETNLINMI